ncbi:hemerythrin domain-containing protein [Streptomyces iconiensis]|uniref:Hemerythrin domain-containing protein n=1 Tax=Streptomyces iconiensis TaxID=1384038 RepID=A0ABT7AAF2_9ACTN|nr:hemerythrin domain-containing protein [Streptomyces iconiensis]MDJ1137979.1 hemerythrin domain-containing protein [Streptomyces iconiensis]
MSRAQEERTEAEKLPDEDVVGVLLSQHARIRDLFAAVRTGPAERRKETFHELRALLAVHETAEEMIVRPVAKKVAGENEVAKRHDEEEEANHVLARLEKMVLESAEFRTLFADFERSVSAHADSEEREEFPALLRECDQEQRTKMGKRLLAVEKAAPTHPHPATAGSPPAQWTLGPFAALADRVRDAVRSTAEG